MEKNKLKNELIGYLTSGNNIPVTRNYIPSNLAIEINEYFSLVEKNKVFPILESIDNDIRILINSKEIDLLKKEFDIG